MTDKAKVLIFDHYTGEVMSDEYEKALSDAAAHGMGALMKGKRVPLSDLWIAHDKSENPAPGDRPLDVRFSNGLICQRWMNRIEHQREWFDITAYRKSS